MPNLDLEALKAVLAKATQGRWFGQYEYDGARTICQMRSTDTTFCINVESGGEENPCLKWRENSEAITELWRNAPALIAELEQARDALADAKAIGAAEWQPIETAPKDGSQFLGWCPTYYQGKGGQALCLWLEGDWYDNKAWVVKPILWRPLPESPAEIRKQAQP